MNRLQQFIAAGAIATLAAPAAGAELFPYIDTAGVNDEILTRLGKGCPDPTPSTPKTAVACVDATWQSMYNIAVSVSNYIAAHPGIMNGAYAQGELLKCQWAASSMNDHSAAIGNPNDLTPTALRAYLDRGLRTATDCLSKIDTAENGIEIWINQEAQNAVIAQINCLQGAECKVERETTAPAPII